MLEQFVKEIHSLDESVDAMQMSEILWLSSIMTTKKIETFTDKKNKPETTKPEEIGNSSKLPRTVTNKIVITSTKEEKSNNNDYSYEADEKSNGVYASYITHNNKFPNIVKQFQALKIKEKKLNNQKLDESKTADYIATTGLLNPIFKELKERGSYLSLTMIIDSHESMFLWEDALNHFTKTLLNSNVFKSVSIYEFDSAKSEVLLSDITTGRKIKLDSPLLKKDKRLTLVFTDVVGKLWRDKSMFSVLDEWSKYSLTAIVSMLPKRMWQKTPLRLGISQYMKSNKFLPKNRDLKSEYGFIEDTLSRNQSKIPVIPYDDSAFEYLSKLMVAQKNAWIESKIFTITNEKKSKSKKRVKNLSTLSAKDRVERYFASAIKEARELAIYASVLPLHRKVLNELVLLKSLGKDMDAFSEFYFGGLLDKSESKDSDNYAFYKGVRKELLDYINMDEIKEVYEMLHRVISHAFGIKKNLLVLLFEHSTEMGSLSTQEKELVELLIEVLGTKGEFFQEEIQELNKKSNTVYLETNHFQMGSENEHSDEKPVHKVTFDKSFEIAKYPVTFEEYDLYCEDKEYLKANKLKIKKPSDEGWGRERRPVINVSWNDAQSYCNWLNDKLKIKRDDEYRYRLPTEAEWEYASRAGTTTKWSFGDDESKLKEYAWYDDKNRKKTEPVEKLKPNDWGLHDMHGNVWEWCQDDWVNSYEKTPRDGTAYEDTSSGNKVLRGGSWVVIAYYTGSSVRFRDFPSNSSVSVGFRLLRTLP